MFYGTVPHAAVQQIFALVDLSATGKVAVCCSGSFKVDRAIRAKYGPELHIASNDVSLYSGAIGAWLSDTPFRVGFTGRLEFVEEVVAPAGVERAAAVLVAFEMGRYRSPNRYARDHFAWYRDNFRAVLRKAVARLEEARKLTPVDEYCPRDWREHVEDAIEREMAIVAFPPFFKGDYEAQFRFLEDNTEWEAPTYPLYDPKTLPEVVERIAGSGVPWCVLTDQTLEGFRPAGQYVAGRKVPHHLYASTEASTVRRFYGTGDPLLYRRVDVRRVTADSELRVSEVPAAALDFLKDVYLAKGIIHSGGVANYLVTIDDMTVGGIIYDYPKFSHSDGRDIYLLSDVTTSRAAKLSKLVAKLATVGEVIGLFERKTLRRIDYVVTTARTPKPVSMKYRGVYKKLSRRWDEDEGQNIIQYGSAVRRSETVADTFRWWWNSYGRHAARG